MSLLTTLLGSSSGGGGGGGGSVSGVILSPVTAGTTTALTVTYANGTSGIGATLTNAGAQAAFAVDGITLTVGQRVLIKDQASALQNGVYSVTTVGSGATNWVLTRTTDFNSASQMTAGTLVEVISGTVNAGTIWELTTSVATVGTNSVSFISINITSKIDQSGAQIYAADGGATDAYAITLSPAPSAYTAGMVINFKANTANTGNATLNVNSLGAKNILKLHDQTLADNDIEVGQLVTVIYDGTQFQMQSQVANSSSTAAATQAEQEAGSSITAFTSPGTQQYHPSAAKFWVLYTTISATSITASYNVTSLTDNGTGDTTINYTVAFSTANYSVVAGTQTSSGSVTTVLIFTTGGVAASAPTTSACRVSTIIIGVAAGDAIATAAGYGDQ